jgi:acyl-CoA-binding protein
MESKVCLYFTFYLQSEYIMNNNELTEKLFKASAEVILTVKKVTDSEKLKLYGLYKQSTCGACTAKEPSELFSPVDHAKWSAWKKVGNLDKHSAMDQYSDLVKKLMDKYNV